MDSEVPATLKGGEGCIVSEPCFDNPERRAPDLCVNRYDISLSISFQLRIDIFRKDNVHLMRQRPIRVAQRRAIECPRSD